MKLIFYFFLPFFVFFSCKKNPNYISETEDYELTLLTSYTITSGQKPNEFFGFLTDFSLKPIFPNPIDFELIPNIPINNHLLGIPECNIQNPDNRLELLQLLGLPIFLTENQFQYRYKSDPIAGKLFFTEITIKAVSMNQIPDLSCFSALESFSMTQTELTDISEEVFKSLLKLSVLDLSNNLLTTVPKAITMLSELTALILANNAINSLNSSFIDYANFKKLQLIVLANNQLDDIRSFQNLPIIEELDLANNHVDLSDTQQINALASLPLLQTLDLSQQKHPNPIPRILLQDSDQDFRKLKTLYYRHNQLAQLDGDFVEDFSGDKKWLSFQIQYNDLDSRTENDLKQKITCLTNNKNNNSQTLNSISELRTQLHSKKNLNLQNVKLDSSKPCLVFYPQK